MAGYDPKRIYAGSQDAAIRDGYRRKRTAPVSPDANPMPRPIPPTMPREQAQAPQPYARMGDREGGYRPPVQQAPAQATAPATEQQGPPDIGPAGRAAALREQFDAEQQKFIRDKQAGLIKFGSPEDLAGRQRLFALSDERKQYDLAARAPTAPLSPTQNAAASQRASGQAAEIIGQDINAARAAGQNTSEMESRLSVLQQKNIGMTREEAIASGLKMAGGTGMGGMLAAGQDVQEGLKKVAPTWMAKGEEYTAMQKNRVGKDVEAAKRAEGRAGDMTAKRNDQEAYAREMETGEQNLSRAAQEAELYQLRRLASGAPDPENAEKSRGDKLKNDLLEAQIGYMKGQIGNKGSPEEIAKRAEVRNNSMVAAGIKPEEWSTFKESLRKAASGIDESGQVTPGNSAALDEVSKMFPGMAAKIQVWKDMDPDTVNAEIEDVIGQMPEPNAQGGYTAYESPAGMPGAGQFNWLPTLINSVRANMARPKADAAARRLTALRKQMTEERGR